MKRMVIHAGFHKTGTTSVQKMLAKNKALLAPHTDIILRKDMTAVCEAARKYSASLKTSDLVAFAKELTAFLTALDTPSNGQVCISSEDLAGHMPGRRSLQTYDTTPILMKAFVHTVEKVFSTPPEMIFYFSTRDADPWLKSCYAQHLGVVRLTLDLNSYKQVYSDSARLDRIVDMTRIAVAPHRIVSCALEDIRNAPFGPLTPLLDFLEIPQEVRDELEMLPPANVAVPDTLLAEYLSINKSDLDVDAVRRAKKEAHKEWRRTQRSEQA